MANFSFEFGHKLPAYNMADQTTLLGTIGSWLASVTAHGIHVSFGCCNLITTEIRCIAAGSDNVGIHTFAISGLLLCN